MSHLKPGLPDGGTKPVADYTREEREAIAKEIHDAAHVRIVQKLPIDLKALETAVEFSKHNPDLLSSAQALLAQCKKAAA